MRKGRTYPGTEAGIREAIKDLDVKRGPLFISSPTVRGICGGCRKLRKLVDDGVAPARCRACRHVHKYRRSKVAGRTVRGKVEYTPVWACRCGARKHRSPGE